MNTRVRRFLTAQARGLTSLWSWPLRRREGVGPDDVSLGYAREQVPMLIAMAGLLGVETMVVGFLVPWPIVHVLDALAVVQVLSIAATYTTRPHIVGNGRLLLREGALFELKVPLTSVRTVRVEPRAHEGPTFQLSNQDDEAGAPEFSIAMAKQTDVVVELSEPLLVVQPDGVRGQAGVLRFRSDEPRAAVRAIRAAMEQETARLERR